MKADHGRWLLAWAFALAPFTQAAAGPTVTDVQFTLPAGIASGTGNGNGNGNVGNGNGNGNLGNGNGNGAFGNGIGNGVPSAGRGNTLPNRSALAPQPAGPATTGHDWEFQNPDGIGHPGHSDGQHHGWQGEGVGARPAYAIRPGR